MNHQPLPDRCSATWIQVHSGRQFWPLNPRIEDIDIEDIAHALSLTNRYAGHTKYPYSVAQHSILMSWSLDDPKLALWALLHDASEAYLLDMPRPLKKAFAEYARYEDNLMRLIAEKFGLSWPMPDVIKELDLQMLATERRDLMKEPPIPWQSTANIVPSEEKIVYWQWEYAKWAFLKTFHNLQVKLA